MRTVCEMLARRGYEVHAIGTTVHESDVVFDPVIALKENGVNFRWCTVSTGKRVILCKSNDVSYEIVNSRGIDPELDDDLTELLRRSLRIRSYDVALTFGGRASDERRRELIRDSGCAVVFGLRNHGYMSRDAFHHVDAVLTPSRFLQQRYREQIGLLSTAIATPIDSENTVAKLREPVFFTFVNPSPEKGVSVVSAIVERLRLIGKTLPFLIIESRGTLQNFMNASNAAGRSHHDLDNVMISKSVQQPSLFFAVTRCLLVPSVWEEPSGRVAAEALMNGIPVLASNRGGLPETLGDGGLVLPLPPETYTARLANCSPDCKEIVDWCSAIVRIAENEQYYMNLSERALRASRRFAPDSIASEYKSFFDSVKRGSSIWES